VGHSTGEAREAVPHRIARRLRRRRASAANQVIEAHRQIMAWRSHRTLEAALWGTFG
jgi:hypothetical protein